MRVKRLEIQGFKSFKDKTVLNFDHGITGIVGPNGCGKSNIVDAFFWVMGEQSYKHMRGSGSEDLIFNGSSKYQPLGLAEATLVMENEVVDTENAPSGATAGDAPMPMKKKEISVTRRVYRGGEGEYFINGVPARLKDIHELFMDTGVGAKGYSVIEQGQIDKVVNSKPDDRRLLIEEAAGIAKYKARKKESLRKLEAAQLNLARLNDVIQEIERTLASLERQAQKARKYKEYKDQLFEKEISWGRRKAQVLSAQIEAIRKEREGLEQELIGLRAEMSGSETSLETDRVLQLTDGKIAEELQAAIQEHSARLTTEKSALELSRQRQEDLRAQLAALAEEARQLETQIAADREAIATQSSSLAGLESEIALSSTACREREAALREFRSEVEKARQDLDALKRELMLGISEASELNSRSAALAASKAAGEQQIVRLDDEIAAARTQAAAFLEETRRAAEAAGAAQSRRTELQGLLGEKTAQVQTIERDLRAAGADFEAAQRKLAQTHSKLQSLEELQRAHEGMADGPKAVLDWSAASGSGKFHAVADLFEVTQGFEHALEGWLEHRIQDLASRDTEAALSALKRLQQEKKGRAVIHLTGSVPASDQTVNSEAFRAVAGPLAEAGFEVMGPLSHFIAPTAELPSSAHAWMQTVCVVKSLESAPAFILTGGLARLAGWSVVSLDGTVLTPDGILRGGSTESDSTASLLGRKRAIQDLQVHVATAKAEFDGAEARRNELKSQLESLSAAVAELRAELQKVEVEAISADREVQAAQRASRDIEARVQQISSQREARAAELERIAAENQEIEGRLNAFLSRRSEVESRIQAREEEYRSQDEEVRRRDAEAQEFRVREASLRERVQSQQRELESARKFVADRERRFDEVRRLLERVSQERAQHLGGDQHIETKIEELVRTLMGAQQEFGAVKERLDQCSARINLNLSRIKELHNRGDEQSARCNTLNVDAERISGELGHLRQNLEEKYGAGCFEQPVAASIQEEMQAPVVTAEMTADDEKTLHEEVESLRERIRRLGEVNAMAIEEYEELHKRFEHLTAERADLEKSMQNLQDAIEHINKTSEDRFRKAFEAIADRFERLFPIVFGGGQARLSLVYPEGSADILDAGVDILAQPPGKKIVNIGLLSGGEKALTAISLVFAIFMVKPSPFCVLDEVDAPLDDSNIGKFNALLREMSARSQFIVITHNKKTMELNDALYGVTMEEPGVSKMVSIELR